MCLQETHSQPEDLSSWNLEWRGPIFVSHGANDARGVCILFKEGTNAKVTQEVKDTEGRFIALDIEMEGHKICLCTVYAPNRDTPEFFAKKFAKTIELSENKIYIGDFNLVLDVRTDRKGVGGNNSKSSTIFQEAMEQLNLSDVWRGRNEKVKRFSYHRKNPHAASRIDFALISYGFLNQVQASFYVPAVMTDHDAFFMSFSFSNHERGRGYWKHNDSRLKNLEYVNVMNDMLCQKIYEEKHLEAKKRWESIKVHIVVTSQDWSRTYASDKKLIISQLYEKISQLQTEIDGEFSEQKEDLLYKSKQDLEDLEKENALGIIFHSKAKWHVEGEHNSKYYLSLEKSKANAKTCTVLIDDNNKKITDQKEVLKKQGQFYRTLYTADPQVRFHASNDTGIRLSPEQQVALEEDVSEKELSEALFQMKNGKCPGLDGITVAFMKFFWRHLKELCFAVIKEGLKEKRLHSTARKGIINLIPKSGRDPRKLKNLRPITLLCVDYKTMEKVLANRIKTVIGDIINRDQRGFMASHRISSNIRKLADLMQITDNRDEEAVILLVDYLKCFDMIEFPMIFRSLEYFGFGDNFISMVKTTYNDFAACIQNNSNFSEYFKVTRSVHQGGPNSSFLFLICAELLAIKIRQDPDIERITVQDVVNLLSRYTDDMDVCMKAKKSCIQALFKALDEFKMISGFTVNYEKTTIYRIGSLKKSNAKFYSERKLEWTNGPVNYLGIWLDYNPNTVYQKNFEPLLETAHAVLTN